jgi:SagB-type dehydrogenase family enzyme
MEPTGEPMIQPGALRAPGDMARLYHELTAMTPSRRWDQPVDDPRVLQDFVGTDWNRWPRQIKLYPRGLPTTPLPRDLPAVPVAATHVLAGTAVVTPAVLDLAMLGRILYLAAGVVRLLQPGNRPSVLMRAAGSAGARFPLEVYVAARGVPGLADGLHWYDPVEHALRRVGPPAADGGTTVVVTGVPWRTGWRYAERGFRHIFWDAGTMLAQLRAAARSAGVPERLHLRFPDGDVTALVGADGVQEFPVALVTLDEDAPATRAGGEATGGAVDDDPLEFPLVTAALRAGDVRDLADPEPEPAPLGLAVPDSPPLDTVILQRGSTRLMLRGAALPQELLEFAMAASTRGVPDPQYVVVHAVDGLEPGLYRWPVVPGAPLRTRDLRDYLTHLCVGQDLGGDASFVVLSCADVAVMDDRDYRTALLRAGLVEGRLHLAAYALGAGASGMTFYDSEVPEFVGEPLESMLFTCVGVPEYANRAGGRPGEPVSVRVVVPRETYEYE